MLMPQVRTDRGRLPVPAPFFPHAVWHFQVTSESLPADIDDQASTDLRWEKDGALAVTVATVSYKSRNAVLLHSMKLFL